MSIKNLFKKPATANSFASASSDIESTDYIIERLKEKETFQPYIDFSNPENFAKYGSAEKYYTKAVSRIYERYPYDGSEKELSEVATLGAVSGWDCIVVDLLSA